MREIAYLLTLPKIEFKPKKIFNRCCASQGKDLQGDDKVSETRPLTLKEKIEKSEEGRSIRPSVAFFPLRRTL